MTRPPRIDFAGIPQHVVQRGNNRLPCFLDDSERLRTVLRGTHCERRDVPYAAKQASYPQKPSPDLHTPSKKLGQRSSGLGASSLELG